MTFLYPPVAVAVLGLVVACPIARRGRGRHLSRPLARLARLDALGVMAVQTAGLIVEAGVAVFIGRNVSVLVMMAVMIVWLLDDLLTGGRDDGPKRKHEWARVKIRMPKPVKLRPVERAPVPA